MWTLKIGTAGRLLASVSWSWYKDVFQECMAVVNIKDIYTQVPKVRGTVPGKGYTVGDSSRKGVHCTRKE